MHSPNIELQNYQGNGRIIFEMDIFYINDVIIVKFENNNQIFARIKDIRKYGSNNKKDEDDCIVLTIFKDNEDFIIYPYKDNITNISLEKEITKTHKSQFNVLCQKYGKDKILNYIKEMNPLFSPNCITINDVNTIKRKFK